MNEEVLGALIVWLIGCTIVAWIAHAQGRSPSNWFGLSLFLSPLIGFIAVILTAPKRSG